MKMLYRPMGAILLLAATSYIAAMAETVESNGQGETGKDIRVGVYVNVQPDCTSGPLPTIRLVEPPAHGKLTVKKGNVNATITNNAWHSVYRPMSRYIGRKKIFWVRIASYLKCTIPAENKNFNISL